MEQSTDKRAATEWESVFKPLSLDLTTVELQVVLSSIGVTADPPTKAGIKFLSKSCGTKKLIFADLVKEHEVIARIARSFWGVRCALHDFMTISEEKRQKVKAELLLTLGAIASQFAVSNGESFLKTHMNYLVSRAILDKEDCPMPTSPLFFGSLKRKVGLRLHRARQGELRSRSFFYTLQMTKKVWLELPESVKTAALEKHAIALTSVKTVSEEARCWLIRATDSVIPPSSKYEPATCCPTFSACRESSRAQGGNHGLLTVDGAIFDLDERDEVREIPRFLSPGFKAVKSADQEALCWERVVRTFGFDSDPGIATWQYLDEDRKGEYTVDVVSLPEPGKFRILSKGPGAVYTGVRSLQGYLLDQWKKTRFSTMVEDLDERVRQRYDHPTLHLFDEVVSGDFSASTDQMAKEVSLIVIDRILQNLSLHGTSVGLMALMNFDKISVKYAGGKVIRMTNGQLMGASLSFPVLCIANLSTVLRLNSQDVLRTALINGDDVSFASTSTITSQWARNIADIGWTRSPGKNYVTTFTPEGVVAMQINSRLYSIRRPLFDQVVQRRDYWRWADAAAVTLQRVGYLPYGLAIGHRVKSEPVVTVKTVPAIWSKLHEHNEESRCGLLRALFLRTNSALLRVNMTIGGRYFTPNWYFPKCLGGLGLAPARGVDVESTVIQRKVAAYLALHPLESWLVEKIDELPSGAQAGLRELRILTSSLVPRSSVTSPVPRVQSLEFLQEQLGMILGHHAWDRDFVDRGGEFCPTRKVRLPIKKIESCKPMNQRKVLDYVFDYCLEFNGNIETAYAKIETYDFLVALGGDIF